MAITKGDSLVAIFESQRDLAQKWEKKRQVSLVIKIILN